MKRDSPQNSEGGSWGGNECELEGSRCLNKYALDAELAKNIHALD